MAESDKMLKWVEAPPGCGKTSVSLILEQENGYKRYSCELNDNLNILVEPPDFLVIDEAQRLFINGMTKLRDALIGKKMKSVICLGISGFQLRCPACTAIEGFLCAKCHKFKCCIREDEELACRTHEWVEMASMTLADVSTSFTVDELIAPHEECEKYIKLVEGDTRNPAVVDQSSGVSRMLRELTGGIVGLVVAVLNFACQELRTTSERHQLSPEWLENLVLNR